MDLTVCDAGHIPRVCVEDEAVVFGNQGDQMITVDEIADSLNTINYEIVTSISHRVSRVYLRSGPHLTSYEVNRHEASFS
jgi:alanine racemase